MIFLVVKIRNVKKGLICLFTKQKSVVSSAVNKQESSFLTFSAFSHKKNSYGYCKKIPDQTAAVILLCQNQKCFLTNTTAAAWSSNDIMPVSIALLDPILYVILFISAISI